MSEEIITPRIGSGSAARLEKVDTERLSVGDRLAFVHMMADMIACAPPVEKIREWAEKYPDRYFYSVKMLGGLMGLAEKVEHEGTIVHAVMNLSDSELMKKLEDLKTDFKHPMTNGQG